MYLPSPLTGRLVTPCGRMKTAAASGITPLLLASGVLAVAASGDSVVLPALVLALLPAATAHRR